MLQIPLKPIAAQSCAAVLAGQSCELRVYQRRTGLFFDCLLNGAPIVSTVLCNNVTRLIVQASLGFAGDFFFFDTQGDSAPSYEGLGSPDVPNRYQLIYLEPSEL